MERKKRSKGRGWESCYVKKIYGTFCVEMRAYGQKLVSLSLFCCLTSTAFPGTMARDFACRFNYDRHTVSSSFSRPSRFLSTHCRVLLFVDVRLSPVV